MLTLYITRHGETEWNVQNRMQGQRDSALTEQGIRNTNALKEHLSVLKFGRIISSPLQRAIQTARILVDKHDHPLIEKDDRLGEISLGTWEGKLLRQIERMDPVQYKNYWERPEQFVSRDGESFRDAQERLACFLNELTEGTTVAGNILIVTHGVIIQLLILLFKNYEISELRRFPIIENNGLLVVDYFPEYNHYLVKDVG